MERAEWLKQIREKAEILYNHYVEGFSSIETDEEVAKRRRKTTVRHIHRLLGYMAPQSNLLSAGCGTGTYDGLLIEGGHNVVGTDFSERSLEQARKLYPMIRYVKMAHHELNFHNEFDGVICIDTLLHVFPEEWPVVLHKFREALKPDGLLYFTVEDTSTIDGLGTRTSFKGYQDLVRRLTEKSGSDAAVPSSFERAKAKGLPVVFGEIADELEECFEKVMATAPEEIRDLPSDVLDKSVYQYHPPIEHVWNWLKQERLEIEHVSRGTSKWVADYHFLVSKRKS